MAADVAEEVAAAGLSDVGGVDVVVDLAAQPGGPEALPVGGQEHRAGIVAEEQLRAGPR